MQRRQFLGVAGSATALAASPDMSIERVLTTLQNADGRTAEDVAQDELVWRDVQQSFSVSRSVLNLNNAGLCPSPTVVTNAVHDLTMEMEKVPPYTAFTTFAPRLEHVRTGLAQMLGADPEEVAIVRNATEALHAVLLGVPLSAGDEILTTEHDYWGMLDALEQRNRRDGVVVVKVPVPVPPTELDDLVQLFERAITPRTRLILLSHPVNLTGQMFPVRKICDMAHARGIEVVLDAAQSFGMIDHRIADLGCDYYGTSLHKWLMGPKGTGMLYVKRDKIEKVWPLMPPPKRYLNDIRKFEGWGTVPATPLAIGEALAFHHGIGGKRKEARFRYLTRYWAERLSRHAKVHLRTDLRPEMSCAIATVDIDGVEPGALVTHLWEKHRIVVANASTRAKNVRGVRVSPSLHNTLGDLDRFVDVMTRIADKGL